MSRGFTSTRALNLGKLCPCSLLAVEITSAQPSPSSRNPSMSYKGSAVVEPRQLAPSVGKKRAGIAISPAPNSANYNSSTPTESMRFGSIRFVPHLPALNLAFHALHEGVNLAFGDFRLHVTREGILRLSDSPRPQATKSATSATAVSYTH